MRKFLIAMILPSFMFTLSLFSMAQDFADEEVQLAQSPAEREIEIEVGEEEVHPARAMLDMGIQYYNEKKYPQAIEQFQKVLADYPGTDYAAEAQFKIGNVYHWGTREPDKALDAYQNVMDNYPESEFATECLVRIGSVYHWEFDKPDPQKAIEYYQQMLSKAPDNVYAPEALFWMGEAYNWMLGDKDKALEIYQKVADDYLQSDYAVKAQLRIADIYRERQWDSPRAREIYAKIASEQSEGPNMEEARYYLGLYYLFAQDNESALRELKAAVNYSTDHIECLYWAGYQIGSILGGCYKCPHLFKGKINEEIEQILRVHREKFPSACMRIISSNPDTHPAILAQFLLGKFYFNEDRYLEAIQAFDKALQMKTKGDSNIRQKIVIERAYTVAAQEQYQKAISELENVTSDLRDKAAILYTIGKIYEMTKDYKSSKTIWNRIINLYPDSSEAKEAKKRVYIIERLGL